MADAKLAKKRGQETGFSSSLLLYAAEIREYVTDRGMTGGLVQLVSEVNFTYPDDFAAAVQDLKLYYFDDAKENIETMTLQAYMKGHYLDRSLWLIGCQGGGKSTLLKALGALSTIRKGKEAFIVSKAYDPLGIMSRTGELSTMGAYVFDDCPLVSLMNTAFSPEDIKMLVDVRSTCAYAARYARAVLPAGVARFFSVNAGKQYGGVVDYGSWFVEQGCEPLAALARRDELLLSRMTDGEKAIARRACVAMPSRVEIGAPVSMLAEASDIVYSEEAAREAAWRASRR